MAYRVHGWIVVNYVERASIDQIATQQNHLGPGVDASGPKANNQ